MSQKVKPKKKVLLSSGIEHRCVRDLLDLICATETMDAVEVVHGRWRWCGSDRWNDAYQCSNCGKIAMNDSNYCPNCGAKMDGGDADVKL